MIELLLVLALGWALFATVAAVALHRGWSYRRRHLAEDKQWLEEKVRDLTATVLQLQAERGVATPKQRKFLN